MTVPRRLMAIPPAAACLLTAAYLAGHHGAQQRVDRADDLGRQGRYAAAAREARAVRGEPERLEALVVEGYALSAEGRDRAALRAFTAAARRSPNDWELQRDVDVVSTRLGERRTALRALARAEALHPGGIQPDELFVAPKR